MIRALVELGLELGLLSVILISRVWILGMCILLLFGSAVFC